MDINNRVKDVRKSLGVSMETFGARIGVTRSAISRIESGVVGVTNQNITAICREYNVNESWLRSGSGSMFLELSKEEIVANIVGNAIASGDDFILSTFIALGQLTPQQWAIVKEFVDKIKSSKP